MSNCKKTKKFPNKLTLESEVHITVRYSRWKIHSSNVDTKQKLFQVWLCSQVVPIEANHRSAFHSVWWAEGGCHRLSSYTTHPLKPHFLLLLASSLTNDSGWHLKQIFLRDGSAGTRCGLDTMVDNLVVLCARQAFLKSWQVWTDTKPFEKLVGNSVFRPQCNTSPIAQHTASF